MTAAAQPKLLHVPAKHLTLDLAGARQRLRCDDGDVECLLEQGALAWVWNIATPGADKRALRFLVSELVAIERLAADNPALFDRMMFQRAQSPSHSRLATGVVRELFGDEKPFVDGTVFRRAFNCDSKHVINLITARVLAVLPNTQWRRGHNGTPAITWASAVRFAEQRRLA